MISFRPPQTKYDSLVEVGKFNMMWNVSLVLVPIFLVLVGIHVFFQDSSWTTSFAGAMVACLNLAVLQWKRKYVIVGIWSVLMGILICQSSIFIINDSHLIADTMWCILIGFFTFFLFGVWVGTFVLLFNLSGMLIFLLNGSSHDILNKGISVKEVDVRMVVNVFYVALALVFIIYKMIKNNNDIINMHEKQRAQNEVLLKEIHHRVKNNLQIISSLLKLQSMDSENETVTEHFNEAINRIRSMALIHEKMYTNDDLSQIDIQSYLIALVQDITETIQSESNIELNVNSEIKNIDIKSIVPVSLIFNELITNSIKHGFKEQSSGKIDLEIIHDGDNVLFKYSDDGTWKEPDNEATFGIELIKTLSEQLNGKCKREINGGTHYQFTFAADQFFFGE